MLIPNTTAAVAPTVSGDFDVIDSAEVSGVPAFTACKALLISKVRRQGMEPLLIPAGISVHNLHPKATTLIIHVHGK